MNLQAQCQTHQHSRSHFQCTITLITLFPTTMDSISVLPEEVPDLGYQNESNTEDEADDFYRPRQTRSHTQNRDTGVWQHPTRCPLHPSHDTANIDTIHPIHRDGEIKSPPTQLLHEATPTPPARNPPSETICYRSATIGCRHNEPSRHHSTPALCPTQMIWTSADTTYEHTTNHSTSQDLPNTVDTNFNHPHTNSYIGDALLLPTDVCKFTAKTKMVPH